MDRMSFLLAFVFFFNDTATPEIYTLSLHDALPICLPSRAMPRRCRLRGRRSPPAFIKPLRDRKSTRLNSHDQISYAVFCLKKKKNNDKRQDVPRRASHRTNTLLKVRTT